MNPTTRRLISLADLRDRIASWFPGEFTRAVDAINYLEALRSQTEETAAYAIAAILPEMNTADKRRRYLEVYTEHYPAGSRGYEIASELLSLLFGSAVSA